MVHKLVQKKHPYLLLRGNTYYFRFATPLHVIKLYPSFPKEVKRSLRTDSYSQAASLVSQKLHTIKLIALCVDVDLLHELYGNLKDFSALFVDAMGSGLRGVSKAIGESNECIEGDSKRTPLLDESPLLSEVWSEFAKWKNWKPKQAKSSQRIYENMLYFLGDVPVSSVTKQHLKYALTSIAELPLRNKGAYLKRPLAELVGMSIPNEDKVSGKYVREHLKMAQSLFNRYLVEEVDLLNRSPTEGLKWEYDNVRFACLDSSQVRRVLLGSKSKPEWFQWFILLSVYSGARRSEVAGLRVDDFKIDADSGRYYFVVLEGKTQAAKRKIPVHSELIEAGVIKWLDSLDGLLFPRARDNPNRATELFHSLLSESVSDVGERIVLHSLRHAFITKARSTGVNHTLLQQVVGHEKTGAGITDRYTHEFPLGAVLCVVDSVNFHS